ADTLNFWVLFSQQPDWVIAKLRELPPGGNRAFRRWYDQFKREVPNASMGFLEVSNAVHAKAQGSRQSSGQVIEAGLARVAASSPERLAAVKSEILKIHSFGRAIDRWREYGSIPIAVTANEHGVEVTIGRTVLQGQIEKGGGFIQLRVPTRLVSGRADNPLNNIQNVIKYGEKPPPVYDGFL
ncbi:MAG: hypothetical protein AAB425_02540, partial [Bdellovibrionota bacterium]